MSAFTSTGPKEKIAVIGIGNEYRGDDGAGIFIAHQLKAKNLPNTHIEFNSREGISLMNSWKGSETTILVDAVKSGAFPGRIYCFKGQTQFFPKGFFNASTHSFSVAETIELARILGHLPRFLLIYGIEGKCFEAGCGLTPEVEKAAGTVIRMVLGYIFSATANVSNNHKGGI